MASDKKMLIEAANIAVKNKVHKIDNRTFLLGAVGERNDGVLVSASNIAAPDYAPDHHAETRLARKLTPNSTVWVARISRKDGSWALARPCSGCELRLRRAGIKRVVYTIAPNEWGVIVF